jgi:hypothetical protein
VTSISLAACQAAALEAEGLGQESLAQAETTGGLDATTETIHQVLSEPQPFGYSRKLRKRIKKEF